MPERKNYQWIHFTWTMLSLSYIIHVLFTKHLYFHSPLTRLSPLMFRVWLAVTEWCGTRGCSPPLYSRWVHYQKSDWGRAELNNGPSSTLILQPLGSTHLCGCCQWQYRVTHGHSTVGLIVNRFNRKHFILRRGDKEMVVVKFKYLCLLFIHH